MFAEQKQKTSLCLHSESNSAYPSLPAQWYVMVHMDVHNMYKAFSLSKGTVTIATKPH